MKANKLILHIGQPKTGSTSIQSSLIGNQSELHARGIGVLKRFTKINNKELLNYALDDDFFPRERLGENINNLNDLRKFRIKLRLNFKKDVGEVIGDCNVFAISSEALSELRNRSEVTRLKVFLDQYFEKVEVVSFFRSQSSHIESSLRQEIKSGIVKPFDLNSVIKKRELKYDYNRFSEMWATVFGEKKFHVYWLDKDDRNCNLLKNFYSLFSLEVIGKGLTDFRENQGLEAEKILMALKDEKFFNSFNRFFDFSSESMTFEFKKNFKELLKKKYCDSNNSFKLRFIKKI